MNLAEQLHKEAEERESKEKAEREAQAKKSREAMKRSVSRETPRLVETCKGEVLAAHKKGSRSTRVVIYDDVAHHAVEQVTKKLEAEGFTVKGRAEYTAVRINGDGYAVGGSEPFAVWELSW